MVDRLTYYLIGQMQGPRFVIRHAVNPCTFLSSDVLLGRIPSGHQQVLFETQLPPSSSYSSKSNIPYSCATPTFSFGRVKDATMSTPNEQIGHNRRKVRKGTRSCWECRGRKVKCLFITSGANDAVCEGCIIRGTRCVSQELPEHPLARVDRRIQMRNRMVRVEQLLGTLVNERQRAGLGSPDLSPEVDTSLEDFRRIRSSHLSSQLPSLDIARNNPTPALTAEHTSEISLASTTSTGPPNQRPIPVEYQRMSRELLSNFPSQELLSGIVKLAGLIPLFFHQIIPKSSEATFQFGDKEKQSLVAELVTRHAETAHPLIVARQMLLLAIAFRYIHPSSHSSLRGLDEAEKPGDVMQRFGDAAISMLERADSMLETPEGLECLLLASSLHADGGNLRSAWSTTRRAMLLAQMIALHRKTKLTAKPLQTGNVWDPKVLWSRIVFFDRFFSLALGLPQGSTDNSMTLNFPSPEPGTHSPLAHLQAQHCALAGRILQRNESNPILQTTDETIAIDCDLQMATQSMPAKWWLVPNLAAVQDETELYQAVMRLTEQVFHNILLTQLHLPFMVQSILACHLTFHEQSRRTCIGASRDLLHRYMALRNFSSVSYCCHSMDFFAVTASGILLLGYLDDHRSSRPGEPLSHQRQSDRAIMEEILDNMTQTGTLDKASGLSERGADILRHLLMIEHRVWRNSVSSSIDTGSEPSSSSQHRPEISLNLIIPSLGILVIKETGEILLRTGDESPSMTTDPPGFSTAQPTLAQSGLQQIASEYYEPDLFSIKSNPIPGIPVDKLDKEQASWLVEDAQMAFLNSITGLDGGPNSINTNSWWLL